MVCLLGLLLIPRHLAVGDGHPFQRIEDALAVASPGDGIEVYPSKSGYGKTRLLIRTPRLAIVGMGGKIKLDGEGFDYSGAGRTPRAIVQIDPGADDVTLENFELCGAHNGSFNGAGVRINQANRVTVRNCDIHDNDMGIMSSGREDGARAAADQLIEHCRIHGNGTFRDPGYSHNLYLGGDSVTVQFCDIYGSLTGHNLKSRAHFNLIQYCHIHDSANRELDFVESRDTEAPNSNAVLLGDAIEKSPACPGNRAVIHFGAERGHRNGTLFLVNDSIFTPFSSAVVMVSTPEGGVQFWNDVVFNSTEATPQLVALSNGAVPGQIMGSNNWFSRAYQLGETLLDVNTRYEGGSRDSMPTTGLPAKADAYYVDGQGCKITASPTYRWDGGDAWTRAEFHGIGAGRDR